jgi:SHS2 domain-containing protein
LIGDVGNEMGAMDRARGQRLAPVEFLRPSHRNPRKSFDDVELEDLAQSIRERGIIQPILVRTMPGLVDVFEIIAGDLAQIRIQPDSDERFHVSGTDPTWLLLDWISELHAAFELRRMLFRSFDVTIDATGLHATAHGERYDPARHTLAHEIKAITQHELSVVETATGWNATLIVDI